MMIRAAAHTPNAIDTLSDAERELVRDAALYGLDDETIARVVFKFRQRTAAAAQQLAKRAA